MTDLRTAAQQALDWLYDNDVVHPTKVSEDLRAALAQQADKPQRPKCFEFALDFLGTPENGELRAYIEQLEARAALAQQAEPLALRLNDQLGLVGWKIDRNPDDTITIVSPSGSSAIVSRMAVWGAREIPEEVLYELAESLMA